MKLGLDISTSVIGYCLLDSSDNVVFCDHIDFKNHKDIYDRLETFKTFIHYVKSNFDINTVNIEDSFQAFAPGKSSASTIKKLNSFNGCCGWIIYEELKIKPNKVPVSSARKKLDIKAVKGESGKDAVMRWMLEKQGTWFVPALNSKGNYHDWNYDRADAYVIARYWKNI